MTAREGTLAAEIRDVRTVVGALADRWGRPVHCACGRKLPSREGRGRPALSCSPACGLARNAARKRAARRLKSEGA